MTKEESDLDGNLSSIAVCLDELKDAELSLRLNSMKQLGRIAKTLGPERTREELLPFIVETIDDEDEVLQALAEQLADFVDSVGGADFVYTLLPALEVLCTIEDVNIRDSAVAAVKKITEPVSQLDQDSVTKFGLEKFLPMLFRLASGSWFTSRVSACKLLPCSCAFLPKEETSAVREAILLFKKLARDEAPTVRRAAAVSTSELAVAVAVVDPTFIENDIFPLFRELAEDEQDSVRILAIKSGPILMLLLPDDLRDTISVPVIRFLANDVSWRVRYMFADNLVEICDAVGSGVVRDDVLPAFLNLVRDNEAEVRTMIANRSTEVIRRISLSASEDPVLTGTELIVRDVLPVVQELVNDSSQHVRAAFASNVMGLAAELGEDVTVRDLLDLVLVLLRDDFPTVRLNVISTLDSISFAMGMRNLVDELLPAIVDLAEDRNWRVRLAIIEHIPLLAQHLGQDIFDEEMKLSDLCLTWLGDTVWSIREAAINNLKSLTEVFGPEWAHEVIVPQIAELFKKSSNYLYRLTSLYAIGVLCEVVSREVIESEFLPLVTELACKDPVPNVRFSAAKTLESFIPLVDPELQKSMIVPCLEELLNGEEKDSDVLNYSRAALEKLSNPQSTAA